MRINCVEFVRMTDRNGTPPPPGLHALFAGPSLKVQSVQCMYSLYISRAVNSCKFYRLVRLYSVATTRRVRHTDITDNCQQSY
jgi:hypothetical protein